MIERLSPLPGGLDGNIEIVFDVLLPDVFGKAARTQRKLERLFFFGQRSGDDALLHAFIPSSG
jgi:hypothetical protein